MIVITAHMPVLSSVLTGVILVLGILNLMMASFIFALGRSCWLHLLVACACFLALAYMLSTMA
jgi:hypothetical protein